MLGRLPAVPPDVVVCPKRDCGAPAPWGTGTGSPAAHWNARHGLSVPATNLIRGELMANSSRDIMIVGLRNAYALEGQALSTMRTVHGRLENYPQLKQALAQHISETERQQTLVEDCLHRYGEEPSTLKAMATKLADNLQGRAHMVAGDEVLKNLFSLFAFEHFEQASYRSLVTMAEAA